MRLPAPFVRTDAAAADSAAATMHTHTQITKNKNKNKKRLLQHCGHTKKMRMPVKASGFDAFAKGFRLC